MLNFGLDISYKEGGFSEILSKRGLKFVLSKKNNTVAFNLGQILLLAKVDIILEKWGRKRDALVTYDTGYVKIVFALSTEIIALYIQASIL